ncbi:hypothetical protein M977_04582 [Buttiauxella gaviniae ATCC 51604]|uniref:Solute-binding protein family 3/N-terminal domain-containing protein n=1 Tax=Buttiauxella gaviniae ATCC 51604 TaxID=1354253 RepID=A0A1B7HLZ2_9ENTR|nr:transporter substrate-binding domain-containing protein [Buttiauxella gaviniae]OAT16672.1 hypothetical protein M977_04582 [Buttiauxella gaviniae ATCC 51604]
MKFLKKYTGKFFLFIFMLLPIDNSHATTLDEIISRGYINIVYHDTPPYSYENNGVAIGFTIDICSEIISAINKKSSPKKITANYISTKLSERLELIKSEKIDLDCSNSFITKTRVESLSASIPIYVTSDAYIHKKSDHAHRLDDYKGRSISSVKGSIDTTMIGRANRFDNLNMLMLPAGTMNSAFEKLTTGEVAVVVLEYMKANYLVHSLDKDNIYEVTKIGPPFLVGILMKKNNDDLLTLVNDTITHLTKTGRLQTLRDRWFTQKAPGYGIIKNDQEIQNIHANATDFASFRDY